MTIDKEDWSNDYSFINLLIDLDPEDLKHIREIQNETNSLLALKKLHIANNHNKEAITEMIIEGKANKTFKDAPVGTTYEEWLDICRIKYRMDL